MSKTVDVGKVLNAKFIVFNRFSTEHLEDGRFAVIACLCPFPSPQGPVNEARRDRLATRRRQGLLYRMSTFHTTIYST